MRALLDDNNHLVSAPVSRFSLLPVNALAVAENRRSANDNEERESCDFAHLRDLHMNREQPILLSSGCLAGADFLPAAGATVGLQNLFSEADGFGGDFDEFVVGDEFDGLLEA
jgi:hypothetical protein